MTWKGGSRHLGSGGRLPRSHFVVATGCRCSCSRIGCDLTFNCTSCSSIKRVCKSTGVSQGGNPHLESQQTLNYRVHPPRNGLPLAVAGGGWSRARPPLSTLTLTPSWTHLVVISVVVVVSRAESPCSTSSGSISPRALALV